MGNTNSIQPRNSQKDLLNLISKGPVDEPLVCSSLNGQVLSIIFPVESSDVSVEISDGKVKRLCYDFEGCTHGLSICN